MKAIITATIVVLLIVSCKASNKKEEAAQAGAVEKKGSAASDSSTVHLTGIQMKNAQIGIGAPEQREMNSIIHVNGVVEVPPQNLVYISVPIAGYLRKTNLIPGQKLSKGTLLAILEDQAYIQIQQDYLTAKAKLEYGFADYERQKGLNENKTVSDKVLQQAKAEYMSQKILVTSLAEKLKLIGINPNNINENKISGSIRLYSPINGYVAQVNVNTGKYISPSDVMFELINPQNFHISLTVFENDASNIRIGQRIVCSSNSSPDEKYTAKVHLITPSIGEDRAIEVHCDLEGNTSKLIAGTFMNAEIAVSKVKVTAVPEDAVVKWQNKDYIFTEVSAGKFEMICVETGVINEGYVEIRNELPAKPVVTRNAYTILMKMKNSAEEE